MAIRLTESKLRQIIREEVTSLAGLSRSRRMAESSYPNLTVKRIQGYAPSDRPMMMRRAEITGKATPVEQIAVECQGWVGEDEMKRAKMQGIEAVAQKIMDLGSEFRWQAKKRGMEATPELARQVAQIFIDLDLH